MVGWRSVELRRVRMGLIFFLFLEMIFQKGGEMGCQGRLLLISGDMRMRFNLR